MVDLLRPLAAMVAARVGDEPFVVGLAGGVAVGKTTVTDALRELLRARRIRVETVTTDGFLYPNAVLDARGLTMRKGFPETFDTPALDAFVAAIRSGIEEVPAPVYSHETYDVMPEPRIVRRPQVLIVEGVNALDDRDRLDFAVFVDAPPQAMEAWYVERFVELSATPGRGSFYARFGALAPDDVAGLAHEVWRAVNLPNLLEHILPTRLNADVVVIKRADHSIGQIKVRGRGQIGVGKGR